MENLAQTSPMMIAAATDAEACRPANRSRVVTIPAATPPAPTCRSVRARTRFLPVAVRHQAVAEVEEAVEMVGPGDEEDQGNRDCGGNGMVCDEEDGDGRKAPDHVPCQRVEPGVAGKLIEVLRFPEREDGGKLQEGEDGAHRHSLYRREVQPAIRPATASSRNGPRRARMPGFFWSYRVNSKRA